MSEYSAKCDAAVKALKLQLGNRQHIYINELYMKLKKKRILLAEIKEKGKTSPTSERDILMLEKNILYQIENPLHESAADTKDDSGPIRGDTNRPASDGVPPMDAHPGLSS